MSSPDHKGHSDIPESMPWKVPVVAAVLGAVLMAVLVISAAGPGPPDANIVTTGFPAGFVSVTEEVAFRVDILDAGPDSTILSISSVVKRGIAPEAVAPVQAASWIVDSGGREVEMVRQHSAFSAPGAVTVEFAPMIDPQDTRIFVMLPGVVETLVDEISVPAQLPVVISDRRIVVGDSTIVIEELTFDDGWGSMRWRLEQGIAAKVDVVVTFDGLEIPFSLAGTYAFPPSFSNAVPSPSPLWGTMGVVRLVGEGQPVAAQSPPTGITVAFTVSVVSEVGDRVEVEIQSVVGP